MTTDVTPYERQATAMERLFTLSPFSVVAMVARINGPISHAALGDAVAKVQQRHVNLRVRIETDEAHNPRFTTEDVDGIAVDVIPRRSADQWMQVVSEASTVPFKFAERPAARFILVGSEDVSELILLCHHIICDGLSLAYVMRDLLTVLGDPAGDLEVLADPTPITVENMPEGISLNPLVRFAIGRMNRKWQADPVHFGQQDYELLSTAYWRQYEHRLATLELSAGETSQLVERCRRERVTVNTALAAAATSAQLEVLGKDRYHANLAVAADLRSRLRRPVGEVMGFYAGAATHDYQPDPKLGFWDNARNLHATLQKGFTDEALFKEPFTWNVLSPDILDAINFKKLGGLVAADQPGAEKLREFASRKDVVQGILKRDKMESPDHVFMGTAITNLTRLDFPTTYGSLELERLIMKPGGAFPLASVNLVVGAATVSGRLSLSFEYVEHNISSDEMEAIKRKVAEFLL